MRRMVDCFISLIALIILSPLFLLIIVTIKTTSKGPVFFTQERIGRNNKNFKLYKFRTMKIDTPNIATHLLKNPEDYITTIGKFLRKSSFDEFPQFLNILKGDMTFIGPRPALYNQYDLKEMRTKVGVHTLLPGVTGWAQINGRDAVSLEQKVKLDEYYLINRSLLLDIKILFMTAFKVIKADGIVEGTLNKVSDGDDKQKVSG